MKNHFCLVKNFSINLLFLKKIEDSVKINLGPTGKIALLSLPNQQVKVLTNGSKILKALDFNSVSGNLLLRLLEQCALKTYLLSGDGSTTSILLACQLLTFSAKFLLAGYNPIALNGGLKKLGYFLFHEIENLSFPIKKISDLFGILNTSLGANIEKDLKKMLCISISKIARDGVILVEDSSLTTNEIETIQGIEIDKGFASPYFVTDLKNYQTVYDNPYLLLAHSPLVSLNQIRQILEYIRSSNRSLVIIAEEISQTVISALILNTIQKKIKVVIIKYSSIKFLKKGILEDLAILTHSRYFYTQTKNELPKIFTIEDLGQVQKVIVKKEKSSFFLSKFSKIIGRRRIDELNRELITSETDYEKNFIKTRIAQLSGNITKIKLGISSHYEAGEKKEKIENSISTIRSSLEEGSLPGSGTFYLYLKSQMLRWSLVNLIGEELLCSQIIGKALDKPFFQLCFNTNTKAHFIIPKLSNQGYEYAYDFLERRAINAFDYGLLDSAKSVRASLGNSLSIASSLIIAE